MRYSEEILTDDNMDEEVEKLAELIGLPYSNYEKFVKTLDEGFNMQTHDLGFEEWLNMQTVPNSTGSQAYQRGFLAYEFANGFIVFHFELLP